MHKHRCNTILSRHTMARVRRISFLPRRLHAHSHRWWSFAQCWLAACHLASAAPSGSGAANETANDLGEPFCCVENQDKPVLSLQRTMF